MSHILSTPFGAFSGKKGDGITQYRGIKYATVTDQLSAPELVTDYGTNIFDATHYGPRAPAIDGCAFEQNTLIQCAIGAAEETPRMSGTECLNLNITVPDTEKKGLPVMVFVHGGGYVMGGNHWPQYDPSRLVKMSEELDMPVIVVNINYRLGVLGNIVSQELRDAGYLGNNSLRDQKCALVWIQNHIEGFGGDPENVTAFGEIAGAASVLYQLHCKQPLFKRCISMSGTPIMLKPLPLHVAELSYIAIVEALGLENASVEERIRKLKTVEPEELVEKTPMSVPLLPSQDGDIVPEAITFAKLASMNHEGLPGMEWCEKLTIGDCQHDGSVFLFMGLAQRKVGIASALETSLHANLPAPAAKAVLQAYAISSATDDDEAMKLVLDLATDIAYVAPAVAYARSFSKAYYYQFNELNPWDGPLKGYSTHMLDAAFLFQNFNKHMSPDIQEVAKGLAVDFLKFANGATPWIGYMEGREEVRVSGPSGKAVIGVEENNGWGKGRRDLLWKLSEEGKIDMDQLSEAWHMFVAGR